jgi:hypothetical protein
LQKVQELAGLHGAVGVCDCSEGDGSRAGRDVHDRHDLGDVGGEARHVAENTEFDEPCILAAASVHEHVGTDAEQAVVGLPAEKAVGSAAETLCRGVVAVVAIGAAGLAGIVEKEVPCAAYSAFVAGVVAGEAVDAVGWRAGAAHDHIRSGVALRTGGSVDAGVASVRAEAALAASVDGSGSVVQGRAVVHAGCGVIDSQQIIVTIAVEAGVFIGARSTVRIADHTMIYAAVEVVPKGADSDALVGQRTRH